MGQIWKRARQDERRRQRSERRDADDMVVDGRLEVEAQDSLRVARTRISQLSSGQRQVVELVIRDGKSYHETAEALGIPIGTVMSRLARARASLIVPE
jgi:RNA polymerase sigma-70 factor, ECF subfamily